MSHLLSSLKQCLASPRLLRSRIHRVIEIWQQGGWRAVKARLAYTSPDKAYQEWVAAYDTLTKAHEARARDDMKTWQTFPTLSVVMPVYNPPLHFLKKAIDSVRAQYYQHWQLCICNDASTDSTIAAYLFEVAALDSRIIITTRATNGHISQASNDALRTATGEWIALLDHDDELSADALYRVASGMRAHPKAKMFFSDEDLIDEEGKRVRPIFKSDYNYDLMLCQNAVTHLLVARKELIDAVGGFRTEVVGAQDWDLTLRLVEQLSTAEIVHIPEVLYHWRMHQASTAQSTTAKSYVRNAQLTVIKDHLRRAGINGTAALIKEIPHTRVHYQLPSPAPHVSILIPTRDQQKILAQCISTIKKFTSYPHYDIIILDNGSKEAETLTYFEQLREDATIKIIRIDIPFNYSTINNIGVSHASGSAVLFLNNDIEVTHADWLTEMVSVLYQDKVGAVGARLYYPNETLQHAGVVFGIGGIAGHSHKGRWRGDPGTFGKIVLPSTFSAVTGACLLTKKELFWDVGGFNEKDLSIQYNDLDLCLKIGALGYRTVYTPFAELIHHESLSRGYTIKPEEELRNQNERNYMKQRWGEVINNDPYYNPNLSITREDYSLAHPPRRSWRYQK